MKMKTRCENEDHIFKLHKVLLVVIRYPLSRITIVQLGIKNIFDLNKVLSIVSLIFTWMVAFPTQRGSFLATHARQLRTCVRINLTVAVQRFVWNISLKETSLKMICASEAATAFNVFSYIAISFSPYQSL